MPKSTVKLPIYGSADGFATASSPEILDMRGTCAREVLLERIAYRVGRRDRRSFRSGRSPPEGSAPDFERSFTDRSGDRVVHDGENRAG